MQITISLVWLLSSVVGCVPATTLQEGLGSKTANMAFSLIHCDAEAGTEEEYQACRACFALINDYNTEDGLDDAKECIEHHLPIAQRDCSSEISLLKPDNVESSRSVLSCFHLSLQRYQARQCLHSSSHQQDQLALFIEAEVCMLNTSENIGKILREDVYVDEDASEGENIGSVLVSAHCEMTNEVIEDRLKCEQCVLAAIVDILMANTTEDIETGLKNLKVCSFKYLSEEHDDCIDNTENVFVNLLDEMKKIQECGTRIMVRNVVTSCLSVLGEVPDQLEMFLQVDSCSQAAAARWMDSRGWGDSQTYGALSEG